MQTAIAVRIRVSCPDCGSRVVVNRFTHRAHCACGGSKKLKWKTILSDLLARVDRVAMGSHERAGSYAWAHIDLWKRGVACPACKRAVGSEELDAALDDGGYTCPCGVRTLLRRAPHNLVQIDARLHAIFGEGTPWSDKRHTEATTTMEATCAECGASLETGNEREVHCGYCGADNVLSDAIWDRLHPAPTKAEVWYLVLRDQPQQAQQAQQATTEQSKPATTEQPEASAPPPHVEPVTERGPSKKTIAIIAIAFGVLLVGFLIWVAVLDARPPSTSARARDIKTVCPVRDGRPLVVIDEVYKHRRYYFVSMIDPLTGKRVARKRLGHRRVHCLTYQGNLIWIGDRKYVEARDLTTGEVVYSDHDLNAKLPVSLRDTRVTKQGALAVNGADGRDYYVSTAKGLSVSTTPPAPTPSGKSAPKRRAYKDRFLTKRGAIELKGHGRHEKVTLDGIPVGTIEFAAADLLKNPVTGSSLWEHPDSVLVDYPLLIKPGYPLLTEPGLFGVTRLGLDGKVRWRYWPALRPRSASHRWRVAGNGAVLVYFTEGAELIGVDVATGRQRYHRHL